MRYAQIDSQGICIGVSDLKGEVDAPNLIAIDSSANPIGKRWENGDWIEVPQPEPQLEPSSPILYAAAQLRVQDFDVTGIGVNSRFGGAFWGDTGKYYVFFGETQPDTDYIAIASAPAFNAYVLDEEKTEDMFVITVTDSAGQPADAQTVNIQILRAS